MNVRAIKTRIFKEGDDLVAFILKHVPKLTEGSVLIVTSKIVALAERRTAPAADLRRVVKEESTWSMPSKLVALTLKDGMLLANAGVDASNGAGKLVLLPKDSYHEAKKLVDQLKRLYKLKSLGVVISDSRCAPARTGIMGVAVGYAGFHGLRNYKGKKDIFGRKLRFTQTNMADSLAVAAVMVMGEGDERRPLCVIDGAPIEFTSRTNRNELIVAPDEDMYRPLFRK